MLIDERCNVKGERVCLWVDVVALMMSWYVSGWML